MARGTEDFPSAQAVDQMADDAGDARPPTSSSELQASVDMLAAILPTYHLRKVMEAIPIPPNTRMVLAVIDLRKGDGLMSLFDLPNPNAPQSARPRSCWTMKLALSMPNRQHLQRAMSQAPPLRPFSHSRKQRRGASLTLEAASILHCFSTVRYLTSC